MAHFNVCDFSTLILLIIVSECSGSVAPSQEVVVATQGEDVRLPCSMTESYRLQLTKHTGGHSAQPKVILSRPKRPTVPDGENVKWRADDQGGMSAFLTAVVKSDEGVYRCQIWKEWDLVLDQNITLKVKECKTLNPVKAAHNSVATLHCLNDTPGHHQTFSWAFLKRGEEISILEDNKRLTATGASLVISPVKDSDSGWYRCRYLAGQTQRCSERLLKVQVTPEATTQNEQEHEGEVTSAVSPSTRIVVASIVTVVTMTSVLIVGVAIYHKHKTQRQLQQPGSNNRRGADTTHSVQMPIYANCPRVSTSELDSTYQSLDLATMDDNSLYSVTPRHP